MTKAELIHTMLRARNLVRNNDWDGAYVALSHARDEVKARADKANHVPAHKRIRVKQYQNLYLTYMGGMRKGVAMDAKDTRLLVSQLVAQGGVVVDAPADVVPVGA